MNGCFKKKLVSFAHLRHSHERLEIKDETNKNVFEEIRVIARMRSYLGWLKCQRLEGV